MTSAYFRWARKMEARLAEAKAKGKRGPERLAPENGRWWVKYKNAAGHLVREPTKAARREEAVHIAHELAALADRRRRGLDTEVLRHLGCDELLTEYLEAHRKLASFKSVRAQVTKWIAPVLKRKPVLEVTPADCQRVIARCLDEGLMESSTREIQVRGRAIFEWARTHVRAVRENPWDSVEKVRPPKAEVVYLRRDEVHALLRHAKDRRLLFLVAVLCGLRKGELAALRWTDISWMEGPHGTLRVRRSWDKEYPKDKEARAIPLHADLAAELAAARKLSKSELVFPSPRGGVRAKNWDATRLLHRAATRAGIRLPEGCVFHTLRTSFLTAIVSDSQGDLDAAQKLAGHSSLQTTSRYYVAKDMDRLASRVASLSLAPSASQHIRGTQAGDDAAPLPKLAES